MLSLKKIFLAGVVIILLVFVIAVRISPYCVGVIIKRFSHIHYTDDSDTSDALINMLLLFLIYSAVAFYWNTRTLRSTGRLTLPQLGLQAVLDLALIPVSILIMVIWNNSKVHAVNMSSLLNPIALGVVHLCRQIIVGLVGRKK